MDARIFLVKEPAGGAPLHWPEAVEIFLNRAIAPSTRRVYALTLASVGQRLDAARPLAAVRAEHVEAAVEAAFGGAAPATWNRVVATVGSFSRFALRSRWTSAGLVDGLERRREVEDHTRSLSRDEVNALLTRRDISVRDRALWRLLYETAARAEEVLRLNVEDIDLALRRAYTVRKGGDVDVLHYQTASARLLPKVIADRSRGPLFLSSRAPSPSRAPALRDLCPVTGRSRLSYRRAAQIFSDASRGRTLHQLRHSAITHLAEDGVPLTLLMAKSRHSSLRTLQRYARPGVEAVAALTAAHDPAARR